MAKDDYLKRKTKKCNTCLRELVASPELRESAFAKSRYAPDGYRYTCRTCDNAAVRVLRAKRAQQLAATDPTYIPRTKHLPPQERAKQDPNDFEITEHNEATAQPAPPVAPIEAPVPPPPPLDPLATAYQRHTVEKQKRDLKREHSALFDENQRLKVQIQEMIKAGSTPEIVVYKQPSWERSDAIACALASDWHVEEPVDKESVHGLNEYNLDIAKARAERFFTNWLRLTDIMARDSKINTMFLGALGDFFSGWIHEELMANTLLAPGDASRFVKGLFISGIDFILRESSYVLEGIMIPGNHGRMTDKMHFSDPTGTSLETVMYDALVDRYRDNPRVRLDVSGHSMRYKTFFEKYVARFIHGYEVKYLGGIGGITIPIRKALAQWNNPIRADSTFMGHWHTFFDGGDFMVNGSLIGYNLFSQGIKAAFEPPRQSFFLINARNGGEKSVVAPIWLDEDKHTDPEVAQLLLATLT